MGWFRKYIFPLLAVLVLLVSIGIPGAEDAPAVRGWAMPGAQFQSGESEFSSYRQSYNTGSCRTLEGTPLVVVVYLDDDVSSWSREDVLTYQDTLITPALTFMEENAACREVELQFQKVIFASCESPQRPVKYSGTVENFMNDNYSPDILDQVAFALGYETKEDMHLHLQQQSGQEQISYVVMMNKGGRSYSICATKTSEDDTRWDDLMEYSLIFTGFTDTSRDSASDTIAHEMLHQFGAEDYYYPAMRSLLAQMYYPTDIMLCAMSDLEYFTIEAFTAYCLGWTDTPPEVCGLPNWWR